MRQRVRIAGAIAVVSLGLVTSACGDDGTSATGPGGATISSLAGTWNATSLSWTPVAGGQGFDLIVAGGSAVLVLEESGRYTFTLVDEDGATEIDTGRFRFDSDDEDILLLTTDGESGEDELFISLSGGTMQLTGDDEFDFDDDGIDEPANFTLVLVRA